MARWQQEGLLDPVDPIRLQALLVPLVDPTAQVASVTVVPPDGPAVRFVRGDEGWTGGPDAAAGER